MKKNKTKSRFFNNRVIVKRYIFIITISSSLIAILFIPEIYYKKRIYPRVNVSGYDLGGKRTDDASSLLAKVVIPPEKIELAAGDKTYDLSLNEISLKYDFEETVRQAYNVQRDQFWLISVATNISSSSKTYPVKLFYTLDTEKLNEYLQIISEQLLSEPTYPEITILNGVISVNKGEGGETLDRNTLLKNFHEKISIADFSKIEIPLIKTDPTLNDQESEAFKKRAEKINNKTLSLINDDDIFTIDSSTLLSFLDFRHKYNSNKISIYIKKEIAPKVERRPQNAVFRFENGKVSEFAPAKDGLTIKNEIFLDEIIKSISHLESTDDKSFSVNIPVERAVPEITLNEINDLGIKELLGRGSSKFRGSISGRIHNISLASSKFNGILIPPGDTFSFNKTLGDVSTFTGYKQAYIIKDGRTVLGDGGGVCQVSTTLFRAALNAGLAIKERRAHSYRVSYYEQDSSPGLDATVYDPTTDLKFTNNTPQHILIQSQFDASNYSLLFEIYGTDDGRVTTITKPIITSSVPPPEDLYVDDPTLPVGTIKQIDYKSWGAKVIFDYTVEKNGEIFIDETFISNYQPWQAVFLRGTGPSS